MITKALSSPAKIEKERKPCRSNTHIYAVVTVSPLRQDSSLCACKCARPAFPSFPVVSERNGSPPCVVLALQLTFFVLTIFLLPLPLAFLSSFGVSLPPRIRALSLSTTTTTIIMTDLLNSCGGFSFPVYKIQKPSSCLSSTNFGNELIRRRKEKHLSSFYFLIKGKKNTIQINSTSCRREKRV